MPLANEGFDELSRQEVRNAIVLTNEAHERDCAAWRERWQVPIRADAAAALRMAGTQRFESDQSHWQDWQLHRLVVGAGGDLKRGIDEKIRSEWPDL